MGLTRTATRTDAIAHPAVVRPLQLVFSLEVSDAAL